MATKKKTGGAGKTKAKKKIAVRKSRRAPAAVRAKAKKPAVTRHVRRSPFGKGGKPAVKRKAHGKVAPKPLAFKPAGRIMVAPARPRAKVKITLTAQRKKEVRNSLLRLRERLTGQIDFLAADNLKRTKNDTELDYRSEEDGTDSFERDFALNRVSSEQDIVFEVDEALNRLQVGVYGVCEACGGAIEKARLTAIPYSRLCLACQSKAETGRKKFRPFDTAALFPNVDKLTAEVNVEEE